MRNLVYLLTLVSGIILFTGCNDKKAHVDENGVTVISVDFNKSQKVSMKDLISRIEIVELEGGPDSYFRSPRWFQVADGKFYMDCRYTEAVYAFDSDGKFLFNTSNRKGNGHNEYLYLNGFFVDKDGCINIYCNATGLVRYDSALNTVSYNKTINSTLNDAKVEKLSFPTKPIPVSDGILAYFAEVSEDSMNVEFYSTALNKTIGGSGIAFQNIHTTQFAIKRNHTPVANDREVLYRLCRIGDFSVFRLNAIDKTITEAYRYDAGNNMFTESHYSSIREPYGRKHEEELYKLFADHTSLWDLHVNNHFMLAVLGGMDLSDRKADKNLHLSFYSPQDGKHRLINAQMDDGKELCYIDWLDDETIYTLVEGYMLDDVDKMVDPDLLDERSKQILKQRNDDTNAYIIKYYLKNDILTQ